MPFTLTWFENSVITTRVYRETFFGTGTNENPEVFLKLIVHQNPHFN